MSRNISYPIPTQAPYNTQHRISGGAPKHGRQTSGPRPGYPNALDSSITRLLVTTKQLLQGLEQWSQGVISENDVSDIYVRLGNGFETCVQAFNRSGIDTYELGSIPLELRECLEKCLSEEQSHQSLEIYLPGIRNIIFKLLEGLKHKQAQYKRLLQMQRYEPSSSISQLATSAPLVAAPSSQAQVPPQSNPEREHNEDPRHSGRSGNSVSPSPMFATPSLPQSQPHPPSHPQSSIGFPPNAHLYQTNRNTSNPALAERERRTAPSRPPPPDAFRPARPPGPKRPSSPVGGLAQQEGIHDVLTRKASDREPQIPIISISPGSRSTSAASMGADQKQKPAISINTSKPTPPRPDRYPRDSFGRPVSRFSMDSEAGLSPVETTGPAAGARTMDMLPEETGERGRRGSADIKRRPRISADRFSKSPSGDHSPSGSGSGSGSREMPSASTLPMLSLPGSISFHTDAPPADYESFQNNVILSSTPKRPPLPSPDTLPIPEVPPDTRATLVALQQSEPLERRASKRFSSYTFNNLNSSSPRASPQRPTRRGHVAQQHPMAHTGADGVGLGLGAGSSAERAQSRGGSPNLSRVREASEEPEESRLDAHDNEPSSPTGSVRIVKTPPPGSPTTPRPPSISPRDLNRLRIYLQIARKTKKHEVDLPITLEQLKLVFMEKFEYDPGKEDFPDVYIRDRDGMEYELESMDDLREGCTLCLNIEPLEQVKLHIDSTFASLMSEMKDLRTALEKEREISRRMSILAPPSLSAPEMSGLSPKASPIVSPSSAVEIPAPTPLVVGPTEDHLKQLQEQHEELESLRRELAITRQAHNEHLTESSASITTLKDEINQLKKITATNPNSNRGLVDASKAELDTHCTDTIKAVEDITDLIDGARVDAYKRFVTPSKQQMSEIQGDLDNARTLVEAFSKAVKMADPTWRGTWQSELHRVMEEQKLLNHQIKLCGDLKKDLEDAETMLGNVRDFVDQRAAGQRTAKIRVGADAEVEGGGIPSLLLEIRTKETDPEQRLRAIEAQQMARQKQRANKMDDFEAELKGFVGSRRLRKTGGANEVDRLRTRKDDVLRAQLTGGSVTPQMTGQSSFSSGGVLSPQLTGASVTMPGALSPQITGVSVNGVMSGKTSRSGSEALGAPQRESVGEESTLVKDTAGRDDGEQEKMIKSTAANSHTASPSSLTPDSSESATSPNVPIPKEDGAAEV